MLFIIIGMWAVLVTASQPHTSPPTILPLHDSVIDHSIIEFTHTPLETLSEVHMDHRHGWLSQAGVPESDWPVAIELINRESTWNPSAVNPSSGACGLGQQLPCGKWKHQWDDPVGALIDTHEYVIGRYGSWASALAWHDSHGWY